MRTSGRKRLSLRKKAKRGLLFGAFALAIVATGAAAPHLSWGHLPISPRTGQTVIILADFLLLFAGFRFYVRSVRAEERERRRTEERLLSSYRYIGVANRKLEIFTEFVERISADDDPRQIREQIGRYLPEVASSLLGTDQAVLRIIDRRTGRTVTEWRHNADGHVVPGALRIRNRRVLEGTHHGTEAGFLLVDAPEGFSTAAVIAANGSAVCDDGPKRFLKTMLRFLHLSFVHKGSSRHAQCVT